MTVIDLLVVVVYMLMALIAMSRLVDDNDWLVDTMIGWLIQGLVD